MPPVRLHKPAHASISPPQNHVSKAPLKPSAKSIPNLPFNRVREGDPHWLRVMETKENQWRFMNTLALHEINLLERKACTELDALSERLDHLVNAVAQVDALVAKSRSLRVRNHFMRVASPALRQLVRRLNRMRTYQSACHAITDSARAVVIPCGDDFVNELAAFRDAAERFGIAAKEAGLYDLTDVAGLLEDLVSVVAREAGMLTCAAQAVAEAASNAERQKGHLVERLLQHNPLRFVPEPSFIE